jgi:hypothetical protein
MRTDDPRLFDYARSLDDADRERRSAHADTIPARLIPPYRPGSERARRRLWSTLPQTKTAKP